MKYNLSFPEEDFTRADALVRATLLASGRIDVWNTPRRVTSDLNELPKFYRDKVTRSLETEGEMLRASTSASPNNNHEFDLWFNPDIVDQSDRFQATVIHELCHGYVGVAKGHNDQWRRLYARSLFHYHYTVASIDHWESLVILANWGYTKRGKSESTKDFLKRINADKDRWVRQAEEERERVRDTWKNMTSPSAFQG